MSNPQFRGEPVGSRAAAVFDPVVSLFFPNRCHFCGVFLETGCCICPECLVKIDIISQAFCGRCGAPLYQRVYRDGTCDRTCIQCHDLGFSFDRNESLGVFTGMLRELVHLYKFGRRRSLSSTFSALLLQYKSDYIMRHDIIIPVPLTQTRQSERGFNQSSLIAENISNRIEIGYAGKCLMRRGGSKPQSSISSVVDRQKNLTDLFVVRERYRRLIEKKSVLLFDDVLTTGSTSSECAKALYKEGAGRVDVLTIARAVKE